MGALAVIEHGHVLEDIYVRVDGADHTSLTVLGLRAVEPDGLVIRDADGVCQELGRVRSSGCGHEA